MYIYVMPINVYHAATILFLVFACALIPFLLTFILTLIIKIFTSEKIVLPNIEIYEDAVVSVTF